ncbi:hypothetical protein [Dendronalium sp. ChiSLP03b]|uniref:hypothetical protein n=1 Tax=Dendronalium sp. ChiSLP03b TaxID=3075381 RepID=UPI002AD343C3|nr:hypothetical protein [Dendronalium sp. ChiSLP03b]MDZ8205836.1 hypothetical protein [Dendronalium sp. ChiSLP03b]
MADLETLINELPKLFHRLNLTIGNSHEIMQQIIVINNVQEQLRNIQKLITQELRFAQVKHKSVSTLLRLGTVASLLKSSAYLLDTAINNRVIFIAEKFGNPETEITLTDLQIKIECWMEWGDLLQAMAADILSDSQLVKQLNSDINYPSLPANFQEIEEILGMKLAFGNSKVLQKQVPRISNIPEEILQAQQRLNYIINTIKNSQNLLTILLGVSSFCGQSGFTLEWLEDDHELIISCDGKFQELTDILTDCELFQEKVDSLLLQANTLKEKAEQCIINLEQERNKKQDNKNKTGVVPHVLGEKPPKLFKLGRLTLVIVSSLAVLGFGGWIGKDKITHIQQNSLSLNQEENAVANFKSALKLGMEASDLVQKPPHPLIVWQQAETKWQQAIKLLATIPKGTSVFEQAQKKLARYRLNYTAISEKALNEKQAVANWQLAQKLATEATFFVQNSPRSVLVWQQARDKWQQAIDLLETIPENTFISKQAKETLPSYKTNYAAMSAIIKD